MGAPVIVEADRDGRPLRPRDVWIAREGVHPPEVPLRLPDIEPVGDDDKERLSTDIFAPARRRGAAGCTCGSRWSRTPRHGARSTRSSCEALKALGYIGSLPRAARRERGRGSANMEAWTSRSARGRAVQRRTLRGVPGRARRPSPPGRAPRPSGASTRCSTTLAEGLLRLSDGDAGRRGADRGRAAQARPLPPALPRPQRRRLPRRPAAPADRDPRRAGRAGATEIAPSRLPRLRVLPE